MPHNLSSAAVVIGALRVKWFEQLQTHLCCYKSKDESNLISCKPDPC